MFQKIVADPMGINLELEIENKYYEHNIYLEEVGSDHLYINVAYS